MLLRRCAVVALVVAAAALAARSDDKKGPLPDGSYLLSIFGSPTFEQRLAILKVEARDGKPAVEVTNTGPRGGGVKASGVCPDVSYFFIPLVGLIHECSPLRRSFKRAYSWIAMPALCPIADARYANVFSGLPL